MTLPASFATFFGRYLLEHGIVEEEVLEDTLMEQGRGSTLLGDLAVIRGYMREKDVAQVFEAQKTSDKPFGELAVEFGVLTPDQLEDLLFVQNVHTSHLGELLLSRGAITETQFEEALEAFSREEQRGRETAEQVFLHHPHEQMLRAFTRALEAAFSRFLKARTKVRAIHGDADTGSFDVEFRFRLTYSSLPDMTCLALLAADFAKEIAERFSGERQDGSTQAYLARCREFMQVVGRYMVSDLERAGAAPASHSLDAAIIHGAQIDAARSLAVEIIGHGGPMALIVSVEER